MSLCVMHCNKVPLKCTQENDANTSLFELSLSEINYMYAHISISPHLVDLQIYV